MAFLIKNSNTQRTAGVAGNGQAMLSQYVHVKRPGALVAQTTTQQLFRVIGGEILIKKLYAKVTVVMSGTDAQLSVGSAALSNAGTIIGTAVVQTVAATSASKEVGSFLYVEGDGTAPIWSNAGSAYCDSQSGEWICPQGEIYESTAASSVTGSLEWHLFYQPLVEGAYAVAVNPLIVAI